MTSLIGFCLSDFVMLAADSRRSGVLSGRHTANVQKIYTINPHTCVSIGGLAFVTDKLIPEIIKRSESLRNLEDISAVAFNIGCEIYDKMMLDFPETKNHYNNSEIMIAGTNKDGINGFNHLFFHKKIVEEYRTNEIDVGGIRTKEILREAQNCMDRSRISGFLNLDQMIWEAMSIGAILEPQRIGPPYEMHILTAHGHRITRTLLTQPLHWDENLKVKWYP